MRRLIDIFARTIYNKKTDVAQRTLSKGCDILPRKFMFTREDVIDAALNLTKEKGFSALTARGLGERLGSSSKPIFGLFKNMKEVQDEVIAAANRVYLKFLDNGMKSDKYPAYKASGMAYIKFAGEEKELFKLLFMRDRSDEKISENRKEVERFIGLIKEKLNISDDDAYLFHIEMWIYVHGIATMIATQYLDLDEEFISRVITDAYNGLKLHYCSNKK